VSRCRAPPSTQDHRRSDQFPLLHHFSRALHKQPVRKIGVSIEPVLDISSELLPLFSTLCEFCPLTETSLKHCAARCLLSSRVSQIKKVDADLEAIVAAQVTPNNSHRSAQNLSSLSSLPGFILVHVSLIFLCSRACLGSCWSMSMRAASKGRSKIHHHRKAGRLRRSGRR
jgi:hypothetical protein